MSERPPTQIGAGPGHVASPCVGVCRMDPHTGWCSGCWRTLDEIAAWAGAADDYKRAVWSVIERRRPAALEPDAACRDASQAP